MKKINMLIIAIICYFSGALIADAGAFSLVPSSTSVTAGSSYTVKVRYSGETLGSAKFNVQFNNVNCTGSSSYSTVLSKCTGSACEVTLQYTTNGYVSGSTLYTLSCTSNNAGTSSFSVALDNDDAFDNTDAMNPVSVSRASATVNVSATTTTTTTKKVTTTTSRQVITTKTTVATTTTKKVTTTGKSETTVPTTTVNSEEEPTTQITENVLDLSLSTTTTTENTTKKKEQIIVPDDLKLNLLKIVGYDIDFKSNLTNYKINVASEVTELYVIAEPVDMNTKVTNIGIIDIRDKKDFIIKVYNELSDNYIEYTININKVTNKTSSFDKTIVIIALFIVVAISALLLSIFKKTKVKLDKIDNVIIEPINANSVPNKKSSFIDEGIIDIPEDEEQLTKVFNNLNNK